MGIALLVATGRARYWQIVLLSLVTGLAHALDAPARQSLVMRLVGREDLVNAVALNSASYNTARIVGPAVAGVLIARVGVVPAFVINGLGFALVLVTLLGLPDDPSRHAGGPPCGTTSRKASGTRSGPLASGSCWAFSSP